MAKRKKNHTAQNPIGNGIDFRVLSAPYSLDKDDSPQIQYERYMEDPERHMEIEGKEFYKIISTYTVRTRGQQLIIAVVENSMKGRVGDILADEEGREFPVTAIEALRPAEMTECCHKTTYLVLKVESMKIGKYLTVKERRTLKNIFQKCKDFFSI